MLSLIDERIKHSKTLPVDELIHYLQEEINSLEARMEGRRARQETILNYMTRTLADYKKGMKYLNEGNVDAALNIHQVLVGIAEEENKAKPNGINPYVV